MRVREQNNFDGALVYILPEQTAFHLPKGIKAMVEIFEKMIVVRNHGHVILLNQFQIFPSNV